MKRWTYVLLALLSVLVLAACGAHSHDTLVPTTTVTTTSTPSTTLQIPGAANAHRPPDFGNAPPGLKLKAIRPSSVSGSVEQWDDVTISLLPSQSKYIGAYSNGLFANTTSARTAFPNATIKTISVTAGAAAQCVDIEPGDATPSEAHVFYTIARVASIDKPCFYFPLTLASAVNADLTAHSISRSQVWEWDAHWTGVPHIDEGFDGTQWTDKAFGRSLDESTLSPAFAGVPPVKPANPHHYLWSPNTVHVFQANQVGFPCQAGFGTCLTVHARERSALLHWDTKGCKNPVSRTICRTTRNHMILLDRRIVHIAHSTPDLKHPASTPRWGASHYKAKDGHVTTLGGMNLQFVRRLSNKNHGVVASWYVK